jgi:hypothetical protein
MDIARRIAGSLNRVCLDATPADFAAARIIVALNALWLLLSRPDLPVVTSLPHGFWSHVTAAQRWRFLAFSMPSSVESVLYAVLVVALLCVLANFRVTTSAVIASVLLYRFAALEPLVSSTGLLWFQCFTHPVLFLLVIAAASGRNRSAFDDRWAVGAMRGLFALYYFLCGFEKLTFAGLRWMTASNIRRLLESQEARGIFHTPLASAVASSDVLCQLIAVGTVALEILFPLVLVSRRARRILVPAALLGHAGIALALGLLFLNTPLLLLFADFRMAPVVWHQLRSRSRRPLGRSADDLQTS